MKKRLLSILCVLSLVLTLLPVTAMAANISGGINTNVTWSDGDVISDAVTLTGGTASTPMVVTVNGTVTVKSEISVVGNVRITGGGTLVRDNSYSGTMLYVNSGGSLTLDNVTVSGGNVQTSGKGIRVAESSHLTINEGAVLTSHYCTSSNGSVMNVTGSVVMSGGIIENNTVSSYGNIYLDNTSSVPAMFTLNGGTICNNTLTDDEIGYGGGAFYVRDAILTVDGGTIADHTNITNRGGAIYCTSYGKVYLNGGAITNNTSKYEGDAIYFSARQGNGAELYIGGNPYITNSIYLGTSTSYGVKYPYITSTIKNPLALEITAYEEDRVIAVGNGYTLTEADMAKITLSVADDSTPYYAKLDSVNNCLLMTNTDPGYSQKYYVTYDGNGATGNTLDNTAYEANDTATVKASTFVRDSYIFTGWNTKADGTGTAYAAGATVTMNGDVRLYAQWEEEQSAPTTYTVTFNTNGGDTLDPATTDTDGKLSSLPTPTKANHTFKGWYTATTGGTKIETSYVFSADTEIFAQWTENQASGTGTVKVAGTDVSAGGYWLCSNNSMTQTDASESNYNVKYVEGTSTLTLKGFTWSGPENGIYATIALNILLDGENSISSTNKCGVEITNDLTINGSSASEDSLSVTSTGIGSNGNGIFAYKPQYGGNYNETITIANATITANASGDVGIAASVSLSITDSVISSTGRAHGLQGGAFGSNLNANPVNIAIENSTITATATANDGVAIKGYPAVTGNFQWRSAADGQWAAYANTDPNFASAKYVELKPGTPASPTTYAVTVTNGTAAPTGEQAAGTEITIAANAPATGMEFKEWIGTDGLTFVDGTSKTSATAKFTMPAQAVAVTATYQNCSYDVTLNTNEGTVNSGNVTSYTYGTGTALPSDVTKANHTFAGWFDNAGLTGDAVTSIGTNETGAKEFWAKWTPDTYTVTLNTAGATSCGALTGYTYGIGATLPTPAKTGYTFMGWYTNSSFTGDPVTAISSTDIGDKTFYAKWAESLSFSYAYDAYRTPTYPTKGKSLKLYNFNYPLLGKDNRGSTNSGTWTLIDIGTYGTVKNQITGTSYFSGLVSGVASNYNVSEDSLTIHELRDGDTHIAYGVIVASSINGDENDFAVFFGDTYSNGAGYLLTKTAKSGEFIVTPENDVTDGATTVTYTVTFDANEGTVTPVTATTGTYGKLTSLPTPTRAGYAFKGWYLVGGTPVTTDTVFTENTTVIAQWIPIYSDSYTPIYPVEVLTEKDDNIKTVSSRKNAIQGDTVTITVTPDPYYQVAGVIVKDASGKIIAVEENANGTFSFKMPASKVTVEAVYFWDNPFVDVGENIYYTPAVEWALNNGITTGATSTIFAPDTACTRAQMVTFLWRASGSPEPASNVCPFTDVDMDSYYGKAVLWAVEKGITNGTTPTTFSPDTTCTRAQMATFLCRMEGGETGGTVNPFTDVPADVYYTDPVLWAVEQGITNGTGDGTTFSPNATCTRGQMVTFLYRCFAK